MSTHTTNRWSQSGWATYAAIMLFGGGIVGMVNGVWALRYDDRLADLVFGERDLSVWGVTWLVGGAVMFAAGIGVFNGRSWARWTGIAISLVAVAWSVGWAEVQPTQALISAFIHISVIFALATHPVSLDSRTEPPR